MTEYRPSQRMLDAAAKGQLTEGGMAEAGWRTIGDLNGEACYDQLKLVRNPPNPIFARPITADESDGQ